MGAVAGADMFALTPYTELWLFPVYHRSCGVGVGDGVFVGVCDGVTVRVGVAVAVEVGVTVGAYISIATGTTYVSTDQVYVPYPPSI